MRIQLEHWTSNANKGSYDHFNAPLNETYPLTGAQLSLANELAPKSLSAATERPARNHMLKTRCLYLSY